MIVTQLGFVIAMEALEYIANYTNHEPYDELSAVATKMQDRAREAIERIRKYE